MLGAVSSLRALLLAGARVDNWACWLHHGLTFAALLLCSLVVSARQYAGDPIDCLFRGAGELRTLDAYCWVQSTFTSARALDPEVVRAHPGVGPAAAGERLRHHAYYRWVSHALLAQAVASAAPHCLWRAYEAGATASAATKEGLKGAWRLVLQHRGNGAFTGWVLLVCEALNLAVDVGQMFFMNLFLDGEFFRHGFEVFPESALGEESREDALARLFPRVTKCSFRQFGPSGDVQTLDGLCVLPINVFNEKVYVVLWFWYWLLSAVAAINLAYRAVLVASPSAREWRLRAGFLCDTSDAQYFARRATFSQFMLAVTLGRQIGGREEFRDILQEVVSAMKQKRESKGDAVHCLGFPARGSYRVNCDGIKTAGRADRSSSGANETPDPDKKQLASAPSGVSDPPKDRRCCSHALELPTRSAYRISYDSAKRADHTDRSCGGCTERPVDDLRQKENADLRPRRKCSRPPSEPPGERLSTGCSVAPRTDDRAEANGVALASTQWPWPGGHVFTDDSKTWEVARDQYIDGGLVPGSDLARMGRSVRQCIEKIEKMDICSADKQSPAGGRDRPQKSWLEPEPRALLGTVSSERDASPFPGAGEHREKISHV